MEVTVQEKVNIVISDEQHEVVKNHLSVRKIDGEEKFVVKKPTRVNKNKMFLFIKRAFDIALSVFCILIFAIPSALIAICVAVSSKGPVFYSQKRLGKNGVEFDIYKFRTMVSDAEKDGAVWAKKDDDRVTTVGVILRKTHLDEIPQFWNILKGDMSFVGPRPERKVFYDEFESYIVGFSHRLYVKPGLTGWAQINGGYELKPEEKVAWDVEYIEKQSLLIDLKCVLNTYKLLFGDDKAR
ncbi:MAG: sugar transferase [Clostridia bacterium]|nr:sugar transferase [Clostridia bacterium]